MNVLVVNRNESYCGNCGYGCDPTEESHDTVIGYYAYDALKPKPCGMKYTHVSTDYVGMEESVGKFRPDLILINWFDRKPGSGFRTSFVKYKTPVNKEKNSEG